MLPAAGFQLSRDFLHLGSKPVHSAAASTTVHRRLLSVVMTAALGSDDLFAKYAAEAPPIQSGLSEARDLAMAYRSAIWLIDTRKQPLRQLVARVMREVHAMLSAALRWKQLEAVGFAHPAARHSYFISFILLYLASISTDFI